MKTLKQWYDKLSESTQKYVVANCYEWFDLEQPDYYKKGLQVNLDLNNKFGSLIGEGFDTRDNISIALAKYLIIMRDNKIINSNTTGDLMLELARNNKKVFAYLEREQKLEVLKSEYQDSLDNKRGVPLDKFLFMTEDFDHIDITKLHKGMSLTPSVIEIVGYTKAKQRARDLPLTLSIEKYKDENDVGDVFNNKMFDELFFDENGWDDTQKQYVINEWYKPTLSDVQDFMLRIVSVDFSYLRFIPQIIAQDSAIASKVYNQKKPDSELTGNERIEQTFRYRKDIRKMWQVAAVCRRKRIGKAMSGTLGECAALARMYGWDFDKVLEVTYPEYV
jgi:hypothetical protein